MTPFERALAFTLAQEGELSEHPDDPGGLTKYGISQRAFPDLDVRNLTSDAAIDLYRAHYWAPIYGDRWGPPLAIALFDTAVNMGVAGAVKLLQACVLAEQDGVIGPETTRRVQAWDPARLALELLARRLFATLRQDAAASFGLGWSRRCLACARAALEADPR